MLIFNEEKHTYSSVHNEDKFISCSTIIGLFHKHFDRRFWGLYSALKNLEGDSFKGWKYMKVKDESYLLELLPKDYHKEVLQEREKVWEQWDKKNLDSRIKGTNFHNGKENEAISSGVDVFRNETWKTIDFKSKYLTYSIEQLQDVDYYRDLEDGYYPELLLFSHKLGLAGTSDKVYIKTINEERYVLISDFKTNGEIKESNKYDKMLYPLQSLDDCVAGNTKLITKKSLVEIKDVVDQEVEIWNGQNWSKVTPFKTGSNRKLYRVYVSDGSTLDVTDNHRFLIKHRLDKGFEVKTTSEIITLLNTTKWKLRVPVNNVNYEKEGLQVENTYDIGFILADGNVHNGQVRLEFHKENLGIQFSTVRKEFRCKKGYLNLIFDLDSSFCKKLKYEEGLPLEMFSWNKESLLKFFAGWIDGDGSIQKKGIRLYGQKNKLQDAQLLLTKCGIKSNLGLMSKEGEVTNLGIRKNDVWYLYIADGFQFPTYRVKSTNKIKEQKINTYFFIEKVEELESLHDTYCLTDKELNQCLFNNILTKQCNANHYKIQIALYGYLLELMGFKVLYTEFTHNKDDGSEIPYPINYPEMRDLVIEMVEVYINNLPACKEYFNFLLHTDSNLQDLVEDLINSDEHIEHGLELYKFDVDDFRDNLMRYLCKSFIQENRQ